MVDYISCSVWISRILLFTSCWSPFKMAWIFKTWISNQGGGTLFYIWKVSFHVMGYQTNSCQIIVPNFPAKLSDIFQGIMILFTLPLVLTYCKQDKQLFRKYSDPYKAILAPQKYNNWHIKKCPLHHRFKKTPQNWLNSYIATFGIYKRRHAGIQERLKTRKYQQKLNFDVHMGKVEY